MFEQESHEEHSNLYDQEEISSDPSDEDSSFIVESMGPLEGAYEKHEPSYGYVESNPDMHPCLMEECGAK